MEVDIEKLKSDFKKEFLECNQCSFGDKVKVDLNTIMGMLISCIDNQKQEHNMEKTGIEIIAEERQRQIEKEGWTPDHDAEHVDESIAYAAACYAIPKDGRNIYAGQGGLSNIIRVLWPWDIQWWKPTPEDRIKELAKAGALCAAEIDRIKKATHS